MIDDVTIANPTIFACDYSAKNSIAIARIDLSFDTRRSIFDYEAPVRLVRHFRRFIYYSY